MAPGASIVLSGFASTAGWVAGAAARSRYPIIPGASGYVSAYFSGSLRQPLVLLAEFDLGSTHLAEEEIDHLQPAVTARDVVDRATLQAFVTAAGEYFIELMETGDLAASSQTRIAFRDPNGPWIHGPAYVAVMRPDSKSRVGGWRASFRVRWLVRRFRFGPQSGSLGRVSSPPLIKPDVRFSRIRLSDEIMPSRSKGPWSSASDGGGHICRTAWGPGSARDSTSASYAFD